MSECIFCRIVAGEIPAKLAGRSVGAMAFHDLNPQAPVHVLVIPTAHYGSTRDVVAPEGDEIWATVMDLGVTVARELGLAEDGYRFVINTGRDGGQSVDHLHLHVLGGRRLGWPPG